MRVLTATLSLCYLFVSCSESQTEKIEQIKETWEGKNFVFNESLSIVTDSCCVVDSLPYTIIYYANSTTCISCLKKAWESTLTDMEDSIKHRIPTCLIVSPEISSHLEIVLKGMMQSRPWVIDYHNEILRLNQIPKFDLLNTLLLDKEHKVLAIGNPIISKSSRMLFLKRIREMDNSKRD